MNALPIEHVNAYANGPVSWITKGTIDLDMHVLFPLSDNEDIIDHILDEIDGIRTKAALKFEKIISDRQIPVKRTETSKFTFKNMRKYGLQHPHIPETTKTSKSEIIMFSKIQFNDLKASIPLSVPQLSYMTNALIRYISTN
jgi:distribution and morphology protein 31